ncbi:MAG: hypothetical protein K0S09_1667 [Sphingobacteriaceae bacterium]|jgi:hypothetical protein|nr:hypothetical protein [Sphingobacteriaceae bacterium]
MAKTKTGYVPPKGRPSGDGTGSGIKEAFAVNDPEKDQELTDKYMDAPGEPSANVHVRHPNRNTDKGRDGDNLDT